MLYSDFVYLATSHFLKLLMHGKPHSSVYTFNHFREVIMTRTIFSNFVDVLGLKYICFSRLMGVIISYFYMS